MRLQRDSYAPKSCAFDAANVQFLRAHLCKSHPVLQHLPDRFPDFLGFMRSDQGRLGADAVIVGNGSQTVKSQTELLVQPG